MIYERITYDAHLRNQADGDLSQFPQIIEVHPGCRSLDWSVWDTKNIPLLMSCEDSVDRFLSWVNGVLSDMRASNRVPSVILSAEADTVMMQSMSLRHGCQNRESNIANFFSLLANEIGRGPRVGVAFCAEELCPGGWDLTDGVDFAQQALIGGAHFLLASAGCQDFPALNHRRQTREKEQRSDLQGKIIEPWLGSADFMKSVVSTSLWVQGRPESLIHTSQMCEIMGIAALVVQK